MRQHWKRLVACVVLATASVALPGCGRSSGDPAPAAAINGSESSQTVVPARQQAPSDPQRPVVVIETSLGPIKVRLDARSAPLTVDNFLSYVSAGHYSGTIVHQVYKGQGIVAGGYSTDLTEKPARTPIRNEAHNGLKNRRGTIAMVRQPDQIDSAMCQFFINVADNPALDHKNRTPTGYGYCVFGEVIEGMEVVDKINETPVQNTGKFDQMPARQILISSIRRVE
ncbi:MAG: peptidylprolyl isomerase [Planctomycetaceae bacterium]|nr:peptidylprolyl isomerase [Planctomycetaceae bacterium]